MVKKVLVVDDQIGIRLLLKDILENEGFQVEEASTGKEAIEKATSQTFDLIMLDYKLPLMDGEEVLKKLEEKNVETNAIIMSGLVENISDEVMECRYVKKILAKPFNINELVEDVKKITTTSFNRHQI